MDLDDSPSPRLDLACLLAARVVARKGHSFIGYFLFSIVMFPVALIVAYIVKDRTGAVSEHAAVA